MVDTTEAVRTLSQNRSRVSEIANAFARYGFASWVAAGGPFGAGRGRGPAGR